MKMTENKKQRDSNTHNASTAIIVCVFFIFTLLILGPINLYLSNIQDLWFSIWDLALIILVWTAIAVVVFFLLCRFTKGKVKDIILCLLFAFGLGFFLQGNFMNISYGVLNGEKIKWDNYTIYAVINTAVWVVIVALPILLYILKRKIWEKVVKFVSILLTALQLVLLIVMFVMTPLKSGESYYYTANGLYDLGKKQNTAVFILDTFDRRYFDELMQDYPDYVKPLDGFTYYYDSTGSYPTTKGAIPFILTGQYYKNEKPYTDYINEAFGKTKFYSELQAGYYDSRIYSDYVFAPNDSKGIANVEYSKKLVTSYFGLGKLMAKFTAFRYFPHVAKSPFWFYSGDFDKYYTMERKGDPPYVTDDPKFYEQLKENGLKTTYDDNTLRIYHFHGAHPPYTMDQNGKRVEADSVGYSEQTRGNLVLIAEYIRQLKQLGLYDNATIIIMADHGYMDCTIGSQPVLLVKSPKATGALKISKAQVSHADLQATILAGAGLSYSSYGKPVFEIGENENRERKYLLYIWDNSWASEYLPDIVEYSINGNARNPDAFKMAGNLYTQNGVKTFTNDFTLGKKVYVDDAISNIYFTDGLGVLERGQNNTPFKWNDKKSIEVNFKLDKVSENGVLVELGTYGVYNNKQHMIIKCGDTVLLDQVYDSNTKSVSFHVPKSCFSENNTVKLAVDCPDAVSPAALGRGKDQRALAFAISYLYVDEAK